MRETQNRPDLDWNENKRKNKIIWLSNCLYKDMEKWIFIKLVLFEMKFIYCVYMLDVCSVRPPIPLYISNFCFWPSTRNAMYACSHFYSEYRLSGIDQRNTEWKSSDGLNVLATALPHLRCWVKGDFWRREEASNWLYVLSITRFVLHVI